MDIYKLSDSIPEDARNLTKNHKCDRMMKIASEDVGVSGGDLKITDLKQGVKNPNRVNVYINDEFAFSLDISQVVDLKLKIGKTVTPEELLEYKNASEFGKLYQRALEWVLVRPRSERETRDYLVRKLKMSSNKKPKASSSDTLKGARPSLWSSEEAFGLPKNTSKDSSEDIFELSDKIIKRLSLKGYLHDKTFAKYYVENRFVKKGISKKRLRMELKKKGITDEIIDEVLDGRDDKDEILKIIAKKRAKYDDDKLIQYLCRQGFPFELVLELVRSYGKD